jgi:xanthine dehydrogenase molybdenum-binding subunit
MAEDLSVVGKRLPRPDGADKVTGAVRFVGDIKLPGLLIGRVLRSPHAHARVLKVDTSKAEDLSGVEAVITSKDMPRKPFNASFWNMAMAAPEQGGEIQDQFIFDAKVRFVGDAVAAVAAVDEQTAEEALALVKVDYESLPAAFTPEEAMKPEAPRIHDFAQGNLCWPHVPFPFGAGDVEKAFQEADLIVEDTFYCSRQKHAQMEPDACIASFDTAGRLTVWAPAQLMHLARRKMAYFFDIPEGMIRWITPHTGGGFGGRLVFNAEPICIALAKKAGRPVKLEYDRGEDFVVHDSRTPNKMDFKLGFKKDGSLTALQMKLQADAGAYLGQTGMTTAVCMALGLGHYRCPNTAGEMTIVYTNTPSTGGMRGYGNPEAMWALQQLMDVAAERLGLDPLAIRLKNFKKAGEPSALVLPIQSLALEECAKAGAERIGWKEKRALRGEGVKRRGVGMATMTHASGAAPLLLEHGNAVIKLNEDGSVNLIVSPTEMGQGILGVLAQIAAEQLGIRAEDVQVIFGDTDVTRFDIGSHASRTTFVTGNAVLGAARQAKGRLLERAAAMLEAAVEDLEVRDRRVYVKGAPEKGISVADVAKDAIYNFQQQCGQITGECDWESKVVSPPGQACFAEVEVDTQCGEVKVLRVVLVHDIGKAINPMNVEGQIDGGVMQGIGYALCEDFVVDTQTGATVTDSFTSYRLPATLDLPEIEGILVEEPDPVGPYGAKSIGESSSVVVAPAIANAIYDAVGVRIKDLPITAEKVLQGLKEKGTL